MCQIILAFLEYLNFKNAKCRGLRPQISKVILKLSLVWIKFRFSKKGHKNLRKPEQDFNQKIQKLLSFAFQGAPFYFLL